MEYFFSLRNEGHDIEETVFANTFSGAVDKIADMHPELDLDDIAHHLEEVAEETDPEK